jgi:hypothetical protein
VLLLTLKLQQDSKNAKTINELTKANKDLAKIIKDAPKEGTKEYKKFEKTLESAKKQYSQNRDEIKKFNKELRTGQKEAKVQADSLKGLSKNLKTLEDRYKLLTKAQRKAADGKALRRDIKRTRAELLKSEKGLGDFRRAVGSYTRSVVGLSGSMGALAVSVGTLKNGLLALGGGFRTASTGAKLLLASLGPIAIVITLITAALSKFQVVIDKVQTLLAGVGAGLDVLAERIGRAGLAFNKLTSLDFQGFADDFKAAFSGIGDEILNDVAIASELEASLQQIRRDRARNLVSDARLEVQIANARRRSQELEKKDRLGALSAINEAIDLTNQKYESQIDLSERNVDALRQQVNLSNETTSIQDTEALAQAQRSLILLEAQRDDAIRGLTRRKNTLSKVNKKEVDQLEELQKRQAELTKEIKTQLLAQKDATANLKEFAEVTAKLLEVEEKFKELTQEQEQAISFQANSIAFFNNELSKLNEKLEQTSSNTEEYKDIQNEIARVEADRALALGDLTKQLEVLNEQQKKNIAELEDAETEQRLTLQARQAIEALNVTTEEGAKKRIQIEKDLEADIRQVRSNRVKDQIEDLKDEAKEVDQELANQLEIYEGNEEKREAILLQAQNERDLIRKRELELEAELLGISVKNYNESEKKKTDATKKEEAKRKQERELAIDTSIAATSKIVELFSILQEQQTQKQLEEIDQREDAQLREAELTGKTEAEKQEIRDKFQAEREALERQAANERKAIALAEAAIDIASAVIKSLPNAPLAAAAAALGAIQLGIIAATNFAGGGLVQPVELESGRIINTPNIPTMKNGDNIFATVKTDEVILNKQQQSALGGPSAFAAIGVPGFASGGRVDFSGVQKASPFATGGLVTRFNSSKKAQAFAAGGVAQLQAAASTNDFIKNLEAEFINEMKKAVFEGVLIGSQQGLENADIKGQIDRENEREKRRSGNSDV